MNNTNPGEEELQELQWIVNKQGRSQEQRRVTGQYATNSVNDPPPPPHLPFSHDTTALGTMDLGLFVEEDEMASWLNYFPTFAGESSSTKEVASVDMAAESNPMINAVTQAATAEAVKKNRTSNEAGGGRWSHVEVKKQKEKIEACYDDDDDDNDHIDDGRESQVGGEKRHNVTTTTTTKKKKKKRKRTRATEVHNLSERRRRDKINEKMKTLQMHIPRCNKSDKASILDDAIEYIKSLQLQIQMMYSGYAMFPMMHPGVQQYSPPLGLSSSVGMDTTPGCLVPQNILPFPPVMHGPPMLSSISSNLSSMMLIRSTCPPSITPRAETSHQDPESFSFLRASYPKQALNFQNLYPNYFGHLHAETQSEVKVLRTDNGTEYINKEFATLISSQDILHQTTCSNTSVQNGVAERKNRHLLKNRASDFGKGKEKHPRMPN